MSSVSISRPRLYALAVLVAAVAVIYVGRLMNLQIASHEYYSSLSNQTITKFETIETTRGEIYDSDGAPLVSNEIHYNLRLNRSYLPYGSENAVIIRLLQFFDKHGIAYADGMPVTTREPFTLTSNTEDNRSLRVFVDKNSSAFDEDVDMFADTNMYDYIFSRYKLDEYRGRYSEAQLRRVAGMRFDLEVADFGVANPFTLLSDIDNDVRLSIADILHDLPGVEISTTAERIYNGGSLAAHVLGRIGSIGREEWPEYKEKGYAMNAKVGKTGAENAFEEYLRGIDGEKKTEYAADGVTILQNTVSKQPKEGYSIRLTIDSDLQKVAEQSLEKVIRQTAEEGAFKAEVDGHGDQGEDADSGAVVVLDVTNGAVKAMASYPSYDQNSYPEIVSDLLQDETSPLLNRATQGIFPPGSTFKPLTAAAALTKGVITADTEITCEGVFTAFEDYQPACWLWNSFRMTHGPINVTTALAVSCNYFFYQIGKDTGITYLDEYALEYGFGVETGIEIGEQTGVLAGPESREERGFLWNPGDVIQAAIGQSDHAFTPLQLASYMATLVNGGTRYKTHLLQSVHNYTDGKKVYETEKEVLNTVELNPLHAKVIKDGMKRVVEENGTAAAVFENYPYPIGGKTGTAQVGKGSETAVFVGFAPFDDPQIAVAVVVEHGHAGNNASKIAKDVFTAYFES